MTDHAINESEFWDWCKKKGMPVDEIKRRWGDAIGQKIREYNWQVKKIAEAGEKVTNILMSDEYGKVMTQYLIENNDDWKELKDKVEKRKGDVNG